MAMHQPIHDFESWWIKSFWCVDSRQSLGVHLSVQNTYPKYVVYSCRFQVLGTPFFTVNICYKMLRQAEYKWVFDFHSKKKIHTFLIVTHLHIIKTNCRMPLHLLVNETTCKGHKALSWQYVNILDTWKLLANGLATSQQEIQSLNKVSIMSFSWDV